MGSRVFAGKLSDHVDRRLVILPFSLLVALAAMCFFIMDNVWMLGLIAILFGLGYGALVPALTALVVDVTRPEERGPALGFLLLLLKSASSLALWVWGLLPRYWAMPICLHCQVSSYW